MRRQFLKLVFGLLLLPLSSTLYAAGKGPGVLLQERVDKLNQYLLHNRAHPEKIQAYLEREVVPFFAVDTMAQWAAGSLSRHMDDRQRELFTQDLVQRFLRTIAVRLADYPVDGIEYLPARGDPISGEIQLGVRVTSQTRPGVQLDFRLLDGEQGWRVFDVSANGISAMTYYRKFYAQQAARYGVRGLLSRLEMDAMRRERASMHRSGQPMRPVYPVPAYR